MTRTTNSRIAGSMFLLYIVTGISSMALFGKATKGAQGTAAKLASIAQNATIVGLDIVLAILIFVIAMVLAVTLYALTRDQDRDLAAMALCFRVGEAVIGAVALVTTLALLSIATASPAAAAPDAAASLVLAALLLKAGGLFTNICATSFAIGSTLYAYLFLRARSIPIPLAWLGVFASLLLVVALPLQLAGFLSGPVTYYIWIPMILFEVPLGLWLLIKGVAAPATR